ncbi:hypothetical protein Tco_0706490 [Tanacetum coccineum]|uniref:Uncharacterized protein n=1 Tax=Tanacetum coccineum TaxID=301880 RepID=A0ABQ4Y7I3_9ASTR
MMAVAWQGCRGTAAGGEGNNGVDVEVWSRHGSGVEWWWCYGDSSGGCHGGRRRDGDAWRKYFWYLQKRFRLGWPDGFGGWQVVADGEAVVVAGRIWGEERE